jgi:hypothetical protein
VILAFLLAVQAAGYTPQEQRAVVASMECLKRNIDAVPRRARRRQGEALIDQAFRACAGEEAALRALLRSRFSEDSAERAVAIVRDASRDRMRRYIGR